MKNSKFAFTYGLLVVIAIGAFLVSLLAGSVSVRPSDVWNAFAGSEGALAHTVKDYGWDQVVGSSGTIRAIGDILRARGESAITPAGVESLIQYALRVRQLLNTELR